MRQRTPPKVQCPWLYLPWKVPRGAWSFSRGLRNPTWPQALTLAAALPRGESHLPGRTCRTGAFLADPVFRGPRFFVDPETQSTGQFPNTADRAAPHPEFRFSGFRGLLDFSDLSISGFDFIAFSDFRLPNIWIFRLCDFTHIACRGSRPPSNDKLGRTCKKGMSRSWTWLPFPSRAHDDCPTRWCGRRSWIDHAPPS